MPNGPYLNASVKLDGFTLEEMEIREGRFIKMVLNDGTDDFVLEGGDLQSNSYDYSLIAGNYGYAFGVDPDGGL